MTRDQGAPQPFPGLGLFDLTGQIALVTGSSRGLGFNMASALCGAGAEVVLWDVLTEELDSACDSLTQSGAKAHSRVVDVTDEKSVSEGIEQIIEDFGRLDILVNNAGITHRGGIDELSPQQWDEVLDTNLKGAWQCSRSVHPVMRSKGWGRILNVASMFSSVGLPERSPYIASKGGMTALTRALAVEFAPDSILVNALAPGPFQTDMADSRARAKLKEAIPLRRWGQPEEIGAAAVFLCSEAASFITGATVPIDGGYTAR